MEDKEYMDVQRQEDVQEPEEENKKRSLWRELLSFIEIFVIAFLLAQFMTRFVLINAEVPSESMENMIEPGDRLFGFRLAYTFAEPERYDVVIFRYPVDETQNYIKRVIGLPGETVEIRGGKIYIDDADTPLEEPYLPEQWVEDNDGYFLKCRRTGIWCWGITGIFRRTQGSKHRALESGVASDKQEAEQYTYVDEEQILGRAIVKYYPHFESLLSY